MHASRTTMSRNPVIGVDFDNTIAGYDELIHRVAVERGLIAEDFVRSKRTIRDYLRTLPDGEIEWQKVQGEVYGPRMREALLMEGACEFFLHCHKSGIKVSIISHKTQFANYDPTHTSLHDAAVRWMTAHDFFDPQRIGLSRSDVYFELSRSEKIDCIRKLACTHFIDDLEETFLEPSFPKNVEKLLYAPHGYERSLPGVRTFNSWGEIGEFFFHDRG